MPLEWIRVEPDLNHRIDYGEADIGRLANDLRANGQLNPVILRKVDSGYELVAGHRRLLAAQRLGWRNIDGVVRELSDDQAESVRTAENLQQCRLTPVEQALALARWMGATGANITEAALHFERSENWVKMRLEIQQYHPDLQQALHAGDVPLNVAGELASISSPPRLLHMLSYVVETGASARTVRVWVEEAQRADAVAPPDGEGLPPAAEAYVPVIPMTDCAFCGERIRLSEISQLAACSSCLPITREVAGEIRRAKIESQSTPT